MFLLVLLIYFNSIKVQLKQQPKMHKYYVPQFQFHKGTIKTILPPLRSNVVLIFQFHKGTIKTLTTIEKQCGIDISIP